jgi:hypothetical protein
MIVKPLSTAVNIQSAASSVSEATLVSVVNTNTVPALIVNSNGNGVYIAAGERMMIQKNPSETLQATTGASTAVWATSVAFTN